MKVPDKYEPIDTDEFGRFDRAMTHILKIPYSELRRRIEADSRVTGKKLPKRKARKKRAKRKTSAMRAGRNEISKSPRA